MGGKEEEDGGGTNTKNTATDSSIVKSNEAIRSTVTSVTSTSVSNLPSTITSISLNSTTTSTNSTTNTSRSSSVTRARKRRREGSTSHYILEVPLSESYESCIVVVTRFGEKLMDVLRGRGVVGHNHKFSTLQADHTRSLLNQMVKSRKGPYQPGSEEDKQYRRLLTLHGLIKATDLLYHLGVHPALQCLNQFHHTHKVLIPGCYTDLVTQLQKIQEESDLTHPKIKALEDEMARARQSGDPNDAEIKVLVVARREWTWLCEQLRRVLGSSTVYLLTSLPEYHHILHVLERHSVVVWDEGGGEGLHQLPWSQFSLVVEWEAGGDTSTCVHHCTRQNIPVVSFTTRQFSGGTVMEEPTGESISAKKRKTSERDDSVCGGDDGVNGRKGGEEITLVASNSVTNNAELHYILTSIYNINLMERCLRDVVVDEDEGHGWPDLLLDERTCVVLQPLAQLRTDTNLNRLTCQLVLLSLQCTTCYIILYSHPPTDSGYMFRSGVVKALARLVATSALFRSPDFTVSLLFAHNLHQVGEVIRAVSEAARSSSTCWDKEEWTTRPWLTPRMSSHERLLLSLPCINSITAQIILTAMSLPDVLTLPLSNLLSALPWIPNKVVTTLYELLHGDAVSVINSYGTTKPLSNVPSLPTKTEDAAASEPLLVDVSEHDQPNEVNQTLSYSDYVEGRVLEESTQLYVNDREVPDVVLLSPYAYHDKSVFTQNTKVECPDTTLSTCVTEAAGDHHTSLHGAFPSIPPGGKYLGNLFNAKDFLGSVPSTAATSLDHQQLTHMQRITATHQVSQVHQQMSQLTEQQQAVPQFYQETQQQIPHQYQHRQYTHQVPQPHQQVSKPQQMPLLHQEISQMQQILQPPLSSQLPKPAPQLQQEVPLLPPSSLQHQQHHVQHYYPQQQEEIVVLSPYFPEVQNDYTQPIGNLPQDVVIPVPASQHNRPSRVSTSEPQGYHGSVTRQGMYCGNVYQQQQQLQQQKQQQQLQQQQLQHRQSHLPQGYWNGSPSLHQQPLTLRPLGNKIFGVAKPYQHHGNASMPVPPSPRVTLRQEGRGHQYPEDYNFPSSQAKGFGASQVPSTPNTKKLAYQKVPGRGGQTKLVFQHD